MTIAALDQPLVIRPSARARLPVLGLVTVLTAGFVLSVVAGIYPAALAVGCAVLYGTALIISVIAVLQARNADWDLRLDADGLTVRGHRTVPWSDLTEVRISGLQPGRWQRLSFGQKVAAFVARPGVDLPGLPSLQSRRFQRVARWSSKRRIRLWGSDLAVLPSMTNADPTVVEAAVRRFSDVPVRHRVSSRRELAAR